jgi:hypothetical protein
MKRNIKYVTKRIQLPTGTVAGVKSIQVDTDTAFDFVTGVQLFENSNASNANYRFGIRDSSSYDVIDTTNKNMFLVAPNIDKRGITTPIYTAARREILFLQVEILATLTAPLDIDVVLVHQNLTEG